MGRKDVRMRNAGRMDEHHARAHRNSFIPLESLNVSDALIDDFPGIMAMHGEISVAIVPAGETQTYWTIMQEVRCRMHCERDSVAVQWCRNFNIFYQERRIPACLNVELFRSR